MAQEDDRRKHLELIQAVIARLANNGFLIKGWAVTLTTGVAAFANKRDTPLVFLVTLVPILVFWCLDATFLYHERRYHRLYHRASIRRAKLFRMTPHPELDKAGFWIAHLFKPTIWPVYLVLLLVLLFVGH